MNWWRKKSDFFCLNVLVHMEEIIKSLKAFYDVNKTYL